MKDTQGMKIKSYFAKSMDEAISKARVELGSDALLLNTRRLPDSGSGAGYEVVMGVYGATSASETTAPARATLRVTPAPARVAGAPSAPVKAPATSGPATTEIEKLRAQMDDLQNLLVRSARNQWTSQRSVPEVAEIFERLDGAEVDPILSRDIAAGLEAAMATDA